MLLVMAVKLSLVKRFDSENDFCSDFQNISHNWLFYLSLDCMGNQNYPWVQTD